LKKQAEVPHSVNAFTSLHGIFKELNLITTKVSSSKNAKQCVNGKWKPSISTYTRFNLQLKKNQSRKIQLIG
jgi:hypothetical protein